MRRSGFEFFFPTPNFVLRSFLFFMFFWSCMGLFSVTKHFYYGGLDLNVGVI